MVLQFGISPALADTVSAIMHFDLGDPRPLPGYPGVLPLAADSASTLGWSFTLNSPVEVLSLGFFDRGCNGLEEPHMVGIWDHTGQLVVSAQVDAGSESQLLGGYRYTAVERIGLAAGRSYVIGATVPLGVFVSNLSGDSNDVLELDLYPFHNVSPDTVLLDSHVSLDSNALIFRGSAGPNGTPGPGILEFPSETVADGYYFASNFRFNVVPEPFLIVLLGLGAVPVLRRPLSRRQRHRSV